MSIDRPFKILPNPAVPEITHFCLPGLMSLLLDTTTFFKDVCVGGWVGGLLVGGLLGGWVVCGLCVGCVWVVCGLCCVAWITMILEGIQF